MSSKTAIIILSDGVEELEATAPIDFLRRAGVDVVVASASENTTVTGRNGIRLTADQLFTAARQKSYDLVVIPGGPGHQALAEDAHVLQMLSDQHQIGGWIGSICAGPVVLAKAGILKERRYTSFPATADALPDREGDSPVVVDKNLITSQGAGTALLFALALVEALCGKATRERIAAEVCHFG